MQRFAFIVLAIQFSVCCPALSQDKPAGPKPLKYWVERLNHADPKLRRSAAKFLLNNNEVLQFGFGVGEQLGLGWGPPGTDTIKRRTAFRREAKPLLPELLKALKNTDKDVVNAASEEYIVTTAAAVVIMALGPEARSVVPDLERVFLNKNSTQGVRMMCFQALLAVMPEDRPIGPIFIRMLNGLPKEKAAEPVQSDAVQTGQDAAKDPTGAQAKEPKRLQRILSELKLENGGQPDTAEKRRNTSVAQSILVFAGPLMRTGHTKIEVPYLVKIAVGEYPAMTRAIAMGVLGAFDYDAKSAVPSLRKLLTDKDHFIRAWAMESLLAIEKDKKLVPEFIRSLQLKDKERDEFETKMREYFQRQELERKQMRELFEQKEVQRGEYEILPGLVEKLVLTPLVRNLKNANGFYQRQAIRTLGEIGPAAKSAIPELRKALNDADADTRRMAAEAIKQIQKPNGDK